MLIEWVADNRQIMLGSINQKKLIALIPTPSFTEV